MIAPGRSLFLVALALVTMVIAPAAQAEWGMWQDPLYPPPGPNDPCFETGDCFTGDDPNPPTYNECTARASKEEECRWCGLDENQKPECQYTKNDAYCDCTTTSTSCKESKDRCVYID